MKIFITGSSGFIGSLLSETLIKAGHQVTGYDLVENIDKQCSFFNGDILIPEKLLQSIDNQTDLIIHLAAVHRDNIKPVTLYRAINVDGTKNLIYAAHEKGINNIVFLSSIAVYGDIDDNYSEVNEPAPTTPYGKSKLEAEHLLCDWVNDRQNRTLTIIRPTVVFGENNRGNVFKLMKQIADNKFIMVGSGQNKKSITYVGNLIEFIIQTLDFNKGMHIYNFADKPDYTMNELVASINSKLKIKPYSFHVPYYFGVLIAVLFDIISYLTNKTFNISKIRIQKFCSNSIVSTEKLDSLIFKRSYTLSEAIEKTVMNEFRCPKS